MYYLLTRYYDPEVGVFLSMDSFEYLSPEEINGVDLYAYCRYNPVMYADPTGHFVITTAFVVTSIIIGVVVGATIGGVAFYNAAQNSGAEGWELFGWIMFGIVAGGIMGGVLGYLVTLLLPEITAFLSAPLITMGATGGTAAAATATISITGAQALELSVALGLILFASDHRPGNNKKQNAQIRDAIREKGYNPKDPHIKDIINKIESYIRRKHLDLGWKDLLDVISKFLS